MEYASPVWDPHLIKDSDQIEKVQRAASQWVTSDYSWLSSVTTMLSNLNWPTLSLCRKISKLQTFYKAIHYLTANSYQTTSSVSLDLHETITTSAMSSHHQTLIHTSLVFFHQLSELGTIYQIL